MTTTSRLWTTVGQLRLPARLAIFAGSILVAGLLAGFAGEQLGGSNAYLMALIAAGICLVGGCASIVFSDLLRGPSLMLGATLLGMMFRMGLPLTALVIVVVQDGPLMADGLPYYLAAIYPLALVLDTVMTVAHLQAAPAAPQGN